MATADIRTRIAELYSLADFEERQARLYKMAKMFSPDAEILGTRDHEKRTDLFLIDFPCRNTVQRAKETMGISVIANTSVGYITIPVSNLH